MLRILIPCLLWLSSVRSESEMQMHMQGMMPEKMGMMPEAWMFKPKRDSYHNPCPPVYSHGAAYSPPPFYVKPFMPAIIPKKEVSVHQAPVVYAHQPSYTAVVPKPMVTYVKPAPQQVIVKPVVQPKVVYPTYEKPPAVSYAPIYQKPIYYAPMYQKPMYDVMPKTVYVKKYEAPMAQIVYQKPQPIHYQAPKVVQVHAPQVNYVKVPQPMVHYLQAHSQSVVKPYCP